MAVIASLVLGSDGSSTLKGSSDEVTTPVDRQRFLARRRLSDAILIGGNTARNERYQRTPVPLVILSRTRPGLLEQNPLAHWWHLSPLEAVIRAQQEFGTTISIEGGIGLISELLDAGAISQLELSITPNVGGEDRVDYRDLISHFEKIEKSHLDETTFYTCTGPLMPLK